MATTIEQQVALDEALVPSTKRLRIGRSNFRLPSDIQSKEPTLQVVYDVLRRSPFFKAFLITAGVPEIYMQEFWAIAYVHQHSIRFKMETKKNIVNLEAFREMLHISPRVPGQSFDVLPFEEEILDFLRFLKHSAQIKILTDKKLKVMRTVFKKKQGKRKSKLLIQFLELLKTVRMMATDVDNFNSFIENSNLIDLPLGGRLFSWMNKVGTKLSKLDRFLISEEVVEALPDVRVTAIDVCGRITILFFFMSLSLTLVYSFRDFSFVSIKVKFKGSFANDDDLDSRIKLLQEDCGSSKALGPDGFSFAFVKKYRDDIKVDILEYVNTFLHTGSLPHESNSSFFTLIPKVDFEKVFDPPSWKYLDFILFNLGFGSKWSSWIGAYLSSSWASVLVNVSPTSELSIKRDLMQGDPLSPFLFILVMKGLHNALSIVVSSGLIRAVKFGSPEVFYLASGLKINIQKSNVHGIGVSDVHVSSMTNNSKCAP
nr:hypothetical protein [Tanacetum cinerariifolium]